MRTEISPDYGVRACTCKSGDTRVHASSCPKEKVVRKLGLTPPDRDEVFRKRQGSDADPFRRKLAGSVGGAEISQDKEHGAEIGRKEKAAERHVRSHMSEIGKLGGAVSANR